VTHKDYVSVPIKEFESLKALVANGGGPCLYCALPKSEWSKCARGFPGCARGDDALLCQHVGVSMEADEKLRRAESFMRGVRTIIKGLDPALYIRMGTFLKYLRGELSEYPEPAPKAEKSPPTFP